MLRGFVASLIFLCAYTSCPAHTVVIYYVNETVPEAVASPNYRALLTVLDGLGELGANAATSLKNDVRLFRDKALADIAALQDAARLRGFEAAIFSNELALRSEYLSIKSDLASTKPLAISRGDNPVTENSPLALNSNLHLALRTALDGIRPSDDVVLIMYSHGTRDLAVMPRVAADFTQEDARRLARQLQEEGGRDLALPQLELHGIRKVDVWKTLSATRARFSLVFLQACESAAVSWEDYRALPDNVERIAHTGFTSIAIDQFDYRALASPEAEPQNVVRAVGSFLEDSGAVYFDSRYTYWRWPLLVTAASLPTAIYFVPLVLCGLWGLLRAKRRIVIQQTS